MKNLKIGKLQAFTICILIICTCIYEICVCNFNNLLKGEYNFSLFRTLIYTAFTALYIIFSKKFVEEAQQTIKSKKKLLLIYSITMLLYTIYIFLKKTDIYRIFLTFIAELMGLLFILYITKNHIKNIIITTITLGWMFCFTNDIFHVMDEKQHFLSALNVASGNFNYVEKPMEDKIFRDIEQYMPTHEFIVYYGDTEYNMHMEQIAEDETDISIRTMNYSPILYIPSAIGINLARLFGANLTDVFLAGRFANLIAFSGLLIIVFKILPFKKDTFYCIYLIPQAVALAAGYSADGLTIGLVGIFIAYALKIYKENSGEIKLKQWIILLGLFLISMLSKSGSYLGICIIAFILPVIKSITKDKKILLLVVILVLLAGAWGLYKFNDIATSSMGDPRIIAANPSMQIKFLLSDYKNIFKVYFNCFNGTLLKLNYYENLNLQDYMGDMYRVVGTSLMILILYTAITDGSHTFKIKEKVVMTGAFLATFLIGTFTMYLSYTPVGIRTVLGYQARYLIPILPLVLIWINSKKINMENYNEGMYNKTALIMGILTLIDILSKIVYVIF